MRKFTILALTFGLTVCGGQAIDSGLSGSWQGQDSGQTVQLNLQNNAGTVTGTADLNFNWFTVERHFNMTGQTTADMAKLYFSDSGGNEVYTLSCQRRATWTCNLYAESGVTSPTPDTALSAARVWLFPLNAVQ